MSSQSYDDGKSGWPINTGNSDSDYDRGRMDREQEWRKRGGGGDGCAESIFYVIALAIAIPSAVAALIGSTLIFLIAKLALRSYSTISFPDAYKAAFWATCTYLIIAAILTILQVWLYPTLIGSKEEISLGAMLKYFYFFEGYELLSILNLFEFHLLCILMSALIFRYKMKYYLKGLTGYSRAVATTLLVIVPSIFATSYIGFLLVMKHYQYSTIY